jgi:hypothetical protein
MKVAARLSSPKSRHEMLGSLEILNASDIGHEMAAHHSPGLQAWVRVTQMDPP